MLSSILLNKNVFAAVSLGVVVVGLLMYFNTLKSDIQELNLKVANCKVRCINEQRQSELYKVALNKQNESVEKIKLEKEKAEAELEAWKSKPAEIKYKIITKIREIKSDDCKDIKNVIGNVRKLDYNSLYR